jgi:hypothetical protein
MDDEKNRPHNGKHMRRGGGHCLEHELGQPPVKFLVITIELL